MFVKQYGRGPRAFFCLHGWSGDHRTFEPLVPLMSSDARLYCADLPGCGSSPLPRQWDLQTVTDEVVCAIMDTREREIAIVGNCIGALIGLRAALMAPRLIQRLVLIDAFAEWPWYFKVFTAPGWGRYAYMTTFANPLGRWMTNQALVSRRSADSDLTRGFAEARHDVAWNYLRILREIRSPAEFQSIGAPVDIVFGAKSFRAIRESAAVWKAMWPDAGVHELRGAGHLAIREAASPLAGIVFGGVFGGAACNIASF